MRMAGLEVNEHPSTLVHSVGGSYVQTRHIPPAPTSQIWAHFGACTVTFDPTEVLNVVY